MKTLSVVYRFVLFLLLLVAVHTATAQVNVTIRVLPPYQSRITEYASRPDLMLLTLTNTSTMVRRVQLTAAISGDNGVGAWVNPGYRSPQPIELAPGQAVSLNGSDIAFLFDHNQITYTGISQADFTRGRGLLEGTYQLCVRALDYDTQQPLSPEEPMGCTQLVISSVEPPTLIQPFNEQELRADGPQAFPITWSTPPGSSPMTQYKVKMVEMIAPRNPNDAMQSATTPPFFEETVNTNMLLYGPQHPQLTPGRQYALMVQAVDPFHTISFRNQGMSEVILFTYGPSRNGVASSGESKPPKEEKPTDVEYATNRITGKLSWAFKASEERFSKRPVTYGGTAVSAGIVARTTGAFQAAATGLKAGIAASQSVNAARTTSKPGTSGSNALVQLYATSNPLQQLNATGMAQSDPTLNVSSQVALNYIGVSQAVDLVKLPEAADIMSAPGSSSLAVSYETVQVDTGSQRYPLANVIITLSGVRNQSTVPTATVGGQSGNLVTLTQDIQWAGLRTSANLSQTLEKANVVQSQVVVGGVQISREAAVKVGAGVRDLPSVEAYGYDPASTVLATARTDAEGNFELQLLNPRYEGQNRYDRLVVSVKEPGFEPYEYTLPVQQLDELASIDLGDILLLARTYRLVPTMELEQPTADLESPGMRIKVFREAVEIDQHPYLQMEGNLESGNKQPVVLNGRKYIPVAIDSVEAGGNIKQSITFSIGKLFYEGNLYVEMEPLASTYKKQSSTIRLTDPKISTSRILVAEPAFSSGLTKPGVRGEVIMEAGESMIPIAGAVVVVSFNKEAVVHENVGSALQANVGMLGQQVYQAGFNFVGSSGASNNGIVSYSSGSTANPMAIGAALSSSGMSRAIALESTTIVGQTLGAASISYSVAAGTGSLTEDQIRAKYGAYAVQTDSTGQFYIGNLPLLADSASYTIQLVNVPYTYRDMEVADGKEREFKALKGEVSNVAFRIKPEVFNLVGRIVDEQKNGIPWGRVHFKGSSTYFETGETGIFQTSFYAGEHTLIVEKEGYVMLEVPIKLGGNAIDEKTNNLLKEMGRKLTRRTRIAPGEEVMMNMANPGTWVESMQSAPTVQQAVAAGEAFSPAMFGFAVGSPSVVAAGMATPQLPGGLRGGPAPMESEIKGVSQQQLLNMAFAPLIAATFQMNDYAFATKTTDLGDIGPMLPRIGKIQFTVVDQGSGAPIPEASIQLFDTTQVTDMEGKWLYEGFGGQATVTVTPPAGSGLIALQRAIQIDETGAITQVTITLERGVRLYGQITGDGQTLEGARVTVEGREYLSTLSDADGNYEFFLPGGEQVVRVAKSGYLSERETRTLQPGGDTALNFDLEGGGGRNISRLLGFDIELDKRVPDGAGEKWSGRFVQLKPLGALFGVAAPVSLPFANIKVTFDAQGNPKPDGNEVQTDVTNLQLKLFGYLPVVLSGNQQIHVKGDGAGNGTVRGRLRLDVSRIQGSRGFAFPGQQALYMGTADAGAGVNDLVVFRAGDEQVEGEADNLRLESDQGSDVIMDLYGFSMVLNLAESSIGKSGLDLAGAIKTPALGPISSMEVTIDQFSISKELRIQAVKVKTTDLPTLKIADWNATLTSLLFNENGFKLGGKLNFTLPKSGQSVVEFSNLTFGKDALYGGQFSFPGEGLNVLNIVKLTSGGNPLSFGRVGNLQVYYLSGSANMKFDKLITKTIKIPSFQVQTDGRFLLESPVNYDADLAFAKFKVKSLTVSTLSGQVPSVSVSGEFKVNFPGLKFNASDIRFTANPNGGSGFSVGTIGGELSVAVMKVGVTVGLKEHGFEGGGKLGIPGTPINAEVDFHYYNNGGNIDIGASFKAGISIPIGIVEITRVGGGFNYQSATKKFMININGGATITGMRALVELNPISLTVESGPVITGQVGVVVGTAFKLVDASITLDVPGKFFAVNVDSDIEPIKGVASAQLHGLLRIKWDPDDRYVFLGVNTSVNVLGLVNSYGEYALGINIWDPKYRNDDIAGYFQYLDDDLYAQGEDYHFSGVYLHTKTEIGVPEERAVKIDLKIVSGKAWFHSYSDVMLLLNFGANDYRFRLAGGLSAGAEGCIGPGCIGAHFNACYAFTGGFRDDWGWFLSGRAGGFFSAHVGKKCDCNELCFIGGRICVGAHVYVSIRTRGSNQFSVGLGQKDEGNSCL